MAGLAATFWVCLGELSTRRCNAYIIILWAPGLRATVPPSFTSDGSDLENDNTDGGEVTCGRASVRHGGKENDVLTWQIRHDVTLRHQI